MTAERTRLHRFLRVALAVQAAGLLAAIALTVPDWIDYQLHPLECGWCIDLRGLPFALSAIVLGPIILVLLVLAWRWRGPRRWPLALVAVFDVAAILLTADITVGAFYNRTESVPPLASAPPLVLLPALATLASGISLVRPLRLRPILAASSAGCILLTVFLWFFAVRPMHQSIPGELSLPFSRTAAYQSRDLGCEDNVQGWVDTHRCMSATLLVYRGSGDVSNDIGIVDQALAAHQQSILTGGGLVTPLPVDAGARRTDVREVDPSNAGLCVIITDRATPPPSNLKLGRCAVVADYVDILSHWPADAAYAIGIIYYWERRDYRDQHSVTFLGAPVGAAPGSNVSVRVRARPNTSCSIVVVDALGQSNAPGLDPKTTDTAGEVAWTWFVDKSTRPGRWPVTVSCGATSGRTFWFVYGPSG